MKAAPYRPAWTSSCLLVQGASGLPKKQRKLIESPGLGLVKKDVSGFIPLLFDSVIGCFFLGPSTSIEPEPGKIWLLLTVIENMLFLRFRIDEFMNSRCGWVSWLSSWSESGRKDRSSPTLLWLAVAIACRAFHTAKASLWGYIVTHAIPV